RPAILERENSAQFPTAKQKARNSVAEFRRGHVPHEIDAEMLGNVEIGNGLLEIVLKPPRIIHLAGNLNVAVFDAAVVDASRKCINRLEGKSAAQAFDQIQLE